MQVTYTEISEQGIVRKDNQDRTLAVVNNYGQFLGLVCDGIGGNPDGDFAAQTAVETFKSEFENEDFSNSNELEIKKWFNDTIKKAVIAMKQGAIKFNKSMKMGATLVGVLVTEQLIVVANVGDSRVYQLRNDELRLITRDQNLKNSDEIEKYQDRIDWMVNHAKNKEAARRKIMGALLSAMGPKLKATPVYQVIHNDSDKTFMLMSDGMYRFIDYGVAPDLLENMSFTLEQKAQFFLKQAEDNESTDNMSLVIVEVRHG